MTRTGIFVYRRADGSEVREYRPAEEVARADSLETLKSAPLTHLHPAQPVTPANVRDLGIGFVAEDVRMDGDFVDASVLVQDEASIKAAERGELAELSCGYVCEIDPTPGVYKGERYDQIQRNIRYNHVALGPKGWGRAGPDVALRMDSDDAILVAHVAPIETEEETNMIKIRLDGQSAEVSEEAAPLVEAALKTRDEALAKARQDAADAEAKVAEAVARADKAEAERDDAKARLVEATSLEAVQKRADARVALLRAAEAVLGAEEKLDGLSDSEIKSKVLAKARPSLTLDGKSEDYITALFDAAVLDARKDGGTTDLAKATLPASDRKDSADADPHARRRGAYDNFRKAAS